jgi:amino-acid N-acetyltransferase
VDDVIFRRALPSDWKAIGTLLAECKLPLDGARDHLETFMVAHDETGLVACGGLELYSPVALLRSVAVREIRRGRGLGQELLMRLIAEALKERVETLVLLTDTAEGYFRRLGFRTVARPDLPPAVTVSAEFRGACPASASAMVRDLSPGAR